MKALLHGFGLPVYGHSLTRLLNEISSRVIDIPEDLWNNARELDRYHTPMRYPNAWPEGFPYEYYASADTTRAIYASEHILRWVKNT